MKLSGKPISSPGRTDKFPPPLMRFLRPNIGNKSRKATTTPRSRSSPMFLRKKTNNNNSSTTTVETTQEPSSPKVTCMGQVRVRKMSTKPSRTQTRRKTEPFVSCRCPWIPRTLFCRQIRPKISWPVLGKWGSFLQLSFRRKQGNRDENKTESKSKFEEEEEENTEEDSEEDKEGEVRSRSRSRPRPSVFMAESDSVVVPIPKNALILTRCRSAPYRSSSLASRFWESPLNSNADEKQSNEKVNENGGDERNKEIPISEKSTENEEFEYSKRVDEEKEEEENRSDELGLAILTRCKSEPARLGEKLYPESIFLKNNNYRRRATTTTRFGFVNSCD